MKRSFWFKYSLSWWVAPLISLGVVLVLIIVDRISPDSQLTGFMLGTVWPISLLGVLISIIYQAIKRKWDNAAYTALSLVGTIVMLCFYLVLAGFEAGMNSTSKPDLFSQDLTIPKNIILNEPSNVYEADSIQCVKKDGMDLIIYDGGLLQKGIYQYEFYTPRIEKGKIYLKAFEITHNTALSTNNLVSETRWTINNPSDSVVRFSTGETFSINEGDWSKSYAARFEVWFVPENANTERKLFEKNYKIYGWQR